MLKLVAVLASAVAAVWLVFLMMVNKEDWREAAYNKVLQNLDAIDQLKLKETKNKKILSGYSGITLQIMKLFYDTDFSKKIRKKEKENADLQKGKLSKVNIFTMPGYSIQRGFHFNQSSIFLKAVQEFSEFNGKKYAIYRAKGLFADMISYLLLGSIICLIGAIFLVSFMGVQKGILNSAIVFVVVLLLAYTQYDQLKDKLKKRRNAISRQFPHVVSKLALLVTSGMIMIMLPAMTNMGM